MSTNTGTLRVTLGLPARVVVGIAAAVVAVIVAVVLSTTFTGAGAEPTTGSGTRIEDSGRANPGREPGTTPASDRVDVGGEGPARFHPLP